MSFHCRHPLRAIAASCAAVALMSLTACGGGGGGGETAASPATTTPANTTPAPTTPAATTPAATPPPATSLPPSTALSSSSSLANICTLEGQQKFVRSYLDEMYLWFDEIPSINAANYTTVPSYFRALLVRTPDATGQPKDRFSEVLTTAAANALQARNLTPENPLGLLTAADAAPGAQAAADTAPGPLTAEGASGLLAAAGDSVPLYKVLSTTGGRRVGYVLFNDHDAEAQDLLIKAFEDLRDAPVADLVLDMRFNSGGFLYVAQTVASMVTGPQTDGRVFEQLRYNSKRQAESNAAVLPFSSRLQVAGTRYPRGYAVPQLNLSRLYVLTSGLTCSASESVINSLRGIDIEVIMIGSATCGKPYGFRRKDNCGLAFFPIEFQGYNARGFGDYAGGIRPTCRVAENTGTALGSANEPLLAAALRHSDTGSCPAAPAQAGGVDELLSLGLRPAAARAHVPTKLRAPWDGRQLRLGE